MSAAPMDVPVRNLQGAEVGRLPLDPSVWGGPLNLRLLSQALAMYRTNQRRGSASTKTRGDVSGGGKKPWKQKHTGRARAGSTRSPLWRHGGSVFGPHPRIIRFRLPQTIRRKALQESLKGKLRDQELVIVDDLRAEAPKTKPFAGLAKTFQVSKRSVIVLEDPSEALTKSLRNLDAFELCHAANLNAFDVLNAHKVLVTKAAFTTIEDKFKDAQAAPSQAPTPTEAPSTRSPKASSTPQRASG